MRKLLAGVVGLATWTLAVASPADAATVEEFTVVAGNVEFGEPEREWIGDGVLHVRGQPITATLSGGLVGTLDAIANFEIDVATGLNYTSYGSFVITTSEVTWEGKFSGIESGATILVGQGDDGSLIRASTPVGSLTTNGTILTP